MQLGIDDPELWLANTPKRVIKTWEAYWRLEPWGMQWHRHATMLQMLDAIFGLVLRGLFSKSKYKPRPFAEWMPDDYAQPQSTTDKQDITKQLNHFARVTSRNYGNDD